MQQWYIKAFSADMYKCQIYCVCAVLHTESTDYLHNNEMADMWILEAEAWGSGVWQGMGRDRGSSRVDVRRH